MDGLLTGPIQVTVIGGTALILGYDIDRGTTDIDSWMAVPEVLAEKWKKAAKNSGVDVKLDSAGVAQAPESFEQRLQTFKTARLKHIEIRYPEAHDLAIMKMCRNMDVDISDIDA